MAFDFVKKHFPIKAHSLDEFIELVDNEGGKSVTAKPFVSAKMGAETAAVGLIADFTYSAQFQSRTLTGRPIIFNEVYATRFGSSRGFVDVEDRALYALRVMLTADDRLLKIRGKLSYVQTSIIGPKGTVDDATRQRLYDDAQRFNVTPF